MHLFFLYPFLSEKWFGDVCESHGTTDGHVNVGLFVDWVFKLLLESILNEFRIYVAFWTFPFWIRFWKDMFHWKSENKIELKCFWIWVNILRVLWCHDFIIVIYKIDWIIIIHQQYFLYWVFLKISHIHVLCCMENPWQVLVGGIRTGTYVKLPFLHTFKYERKQYVF